MSNTSFLKRKLQAQFTLKSGSFEDGSNSKIVTDLAMSCTVEKLGPPDFGKCSLTVRGMLLEDMEQLTTLSFTPQFAYTAKNYLNIFAGDDLNGFSQIFAGSITSAGAEFSEGQPGAAFKVEGQIGYNGSVKAQAPTSINGSQTLSNFIEQQANSAGMSFENQGVTASISNCIFNGSPVQQARQAAERAGCDLLIDDETLILLPKNGVRDSEQVPLLNKDSGLLGYPKITQSGIEVKSIFNPVYKLGQTFVLESIVPKASGTWQITKLVHKLAANEPGDGSWESQITATYNYNASTD